MEELPGGREYLKAFFVGHAPSEDGQHFLQGLSGKADSNISTPGLCPAHGQANNLAPRKAKARATNKRH